MSAPDIYDGRSFDALLFDMDGTLLSSIEAAERVWSRWAVRHGIDPASFLPTLHGMRSIDTIRRQNLAGIDPEREAALLTEEEMIDVDGIHPIAGAAAFVAALPAERWAIVTSAPRLLAERRLAAAGLPSPAVLVAAEDVAIGKPDPTGYRMAAERLGFAAEACLVLEDAPPGVAAGEAAGAAVLVIAATHRAALASPHAIVDDFRGLRPVADAGGRIVIRRAPAGG